MPRFIPSRLAAAMEAGYDPDYDDVREERVFTGHTCPDCGHEWEEDRILDSGDSRDATCPECDYADIPADHEEVIEDDGSPGWSVRD